MQGLWAHSGACSSVLRPSGLEGHAVSRARRAAHPTFFLADLLSLPKAQPLRPKKLALSSSPLSKTWKGRSRFHAGCQSLLI